MQAIDTEKEKKMAEKGTGGRQGEGGLLGKLLPPCYTDAGPGTRFVPIIEADQMSQAATEICDNRTSAQKVAEHQLQQYVHEDHPFFPSTNATIRQQSQQQQLQQNDQADRESPRPQSPPPVSRVQMPTRNVSVASTAPETGTGRFSPSNLARSNSEMEASVGKEDNLQQDLVDKSTAAEVNETSSGGMRFEFDGEDVEVTAWDNAAFRKKFAPGDESGSETGESRDVSQPQLRQQQVPQHHRQWLVAHADDDNGNNETEFRGVSRDNNNMHPLSTALRDSSLFERDSDILSDVNSNVSEYGTVINLGGQAARMAEVEAMAALIEASPHFDYYDNENSQSPLNEHPRNPEPDEIVEFGPALPSLESNNENDNLSLAYDLGHRVSSLPKIQFKPQQQTLTSTRKDLDFNSHGLDARADGASAMVSATLRRLGTNRNNVGSTNNNNSAKKKFLQLRTNNYATEQTLSAPPTPGTPSMPPTSRMEDLLKLTLSPKTNSQDPPTIFSMQSPGSAAHHSISNHQGANQRIDATVINNSTTATALAASVSERNGRVGNSPFDVDLVRRSAETTAVILEKHEAAAITPSRTEHMKQSMASSLGDMLPGPFRFAKKCMSFDSTLDEQNPIPYPVEKMSAFPSSSSRSPDRHNMTQPRQLIRLSTSWDVGGPSDFSFTERDHHRSNISKMTASPQRWQKQDAFRAEPTRRAGPVFRSATSQEERDQQQRARLQSDFSPSKTSNAVELQTPQRIEIEREDALDILACLVARGVTLHQDRAKCSFSGRAQDKEKPEDGHDDDCDPDRDSVDGFSRKLKTGSADEHISERFSDANIASAVEELRMMSKERKISGEEADSSRGSHTDRMAALDELLLSHAYALEMKRAALSASAWLNSIGRLSTDRPGDSSTSNDQPTTSKANSSSLLQIEAAGGQASGEGSHVMNRSADKMELLSITAQLHTAQMEAKEKAAVAKKLNEELSNCRAEIGRLRSVYRSEATALSQQDKSILDDHETEESATSAIAEAMHRVNESQSPIPKGGSDAGEQVNVSRTESLFRGLDDEADQLDALVMKNALDQANEVIQKLHAELSKLTQKSSDAPLVDVPDISSCSQSSEDNPMVNVRMLDGENFVTEWDDLRPPLPPPPDHGLRSPIVDTLLEQWTSDPALHESLLLWMERVMAGHDLESVPPLTISSLDHQVRDGFSMHVLPLLLRRPDIHVSVQTRAHRSTMYDLAVTVNPKVQHHTLPHRVTSFIQSNLSHKSDAYANMKAGMRDIDQSSNVTELVTNVSKPGSPSPYKSFPPYRGDADDNFVGPITAAEHSELSAGLGHQQGIMSALGGALGGILSRRKYSASSPTRFSEAGSTMPAGFKAQMDLTSSTVPIHFSKEEELPYHRVVSTPSGRIGVTFVEFRGHAMVSDVAKDSPLSGWVFPSDILIAIDELPVSGMRVRDIVKVLTTRKDRQRALRVISSHAMNEFTNNASNME